MALLATALGLSAAVAAPAWGHAAFLGSTPAPGARLRQAPALVTLTFTEGLNRTLSTAAIYDARGRRVAARAATPSSRRIVVRPARPLPRGGYRVEWHSVAADDGHALEGSFAFGVRTAAMSGTRSSEGSPLAGTGWLRAIVRALLYCSLLLFVGALMLSAALDRPAAPSWLVRDVHGTLVDPTTVARHHRSVVLYAGLLAFVLAAVSALLDVADAAGHLSGPAIHNFLLSNTSGLARVGVVAFVALALAGMAARRRLLAAAAAALALGALVLAGHADSTSPRGVALAADWIHLLGAATWLGGIGLVVVTWLPALRRGTGDLRLAVMRNVLPRFGRVALPAFAVVVVAGLTNALVELGQVSALWQTDYGRILMLKIALVALIATASYVHAMRLRPRLLAANPHPNRQTEQRHWRLLASEPLLGIAVAASVAVLVAFPAPRAGALTSSATRQVASAPCRPACPLPRPKPDELAVADEAGSEIVAAWLRHTPHGLSGEVRLLDVKSRPATTPFEINDALSVNVSCGPGCRRFTTSGGPDVLSISVSEGRSTYVARLPTKWRRGQSRRAKQLLVRAQATMRRLSSVRDTERVNSVPGLFAITDYRLQAPDRYAYATRVLRVTGTRRSSKPEGQRVVIGTTTWDRELDTGWRRSVDRGGLPFRTRTWFTWVTYAEAARLLVVRREHGRRVAILALMDPGTPAWTRVFIDLATMRVLHTRFVTSGHFMTQRFADYDKPMQIRPPRHAVRAPG